MNIQALKNKLKAYFIPEEWCVAVRFNKDDAADLLTDRDSPFVIVPNSLRYWAADPFLEKYKDKYYLFFEMYDRLKRKGLLGCREISPGGFGKMNVIYESDSHLSYPFVFNKNSEHYIIPESGAAGELFRLRAVDFPYKWEKEKTLLKRRLSDTTLFETDSTVYYISQEIDDSYTFDKINLFYEENGEIVSCKNNPVKTDINSARCAGKIFLHNGDCIRPSQDCGSAYGDKLNFNRMDSISKDNYFETEITAVSAKDIKLDKYNKYIGIHTYNRLDNIEVIDLKLPYRFNFINAVGVIIKLTKKLLNN